jgi:hypothetical protein
MPTLDFANAAPFYFEANGVQHPIIGGALHTIPTPEGNLNWDWVIECAFKKSDVIPFDKKCAILWDDRTVLVWVQVLERDKGKLKLVPYFEMAV